VQAIYRSRRYANLRVVDKANGGKADALNAGINAARYGLFCGVDADSILQRDSLLRVVQPFLEDERTIAAGGTVRIANGSQVRGGFLIQAGLPRNWLARFQIVEYLRAFLFGRLGWSPLNAVLIISGAFGLFDRERVMAVGGYRTDTVGEDME
ncbi:glycosyltransferase family 2 protein, partial [Stutzerimonas stutzeri]